MAVLNIEDSFEDNQNAKCKYEKRNGDLLKVVKNRLPILEWLPKYKFDYFIQDFIAGITVGLTAIAQGIAYATIAGLPPQYGLYGSLTAGIVYMCLGKSFCLTIGPTAILSAVLAKYVAGYSPDFAVLLTFLSGLFILLTGILNLGFLVEFISMPVIKGFTTAAVLQIATSQFKALFGTDGPSGYYFAESVYNFINNITTVKLWETVLGIGTMLILILSKKMGEGCERTDGFIKKTRWYISTSRNAVVVILGMIIAYIIKVTLHIEPLVLVGDISSGLPKFQLPPFSTNVANVTFSFIDMVNTLGPQTAVVPFVSMLEVIAISKAFSSDGRIDATQELIAVGMCNIIGSFGQSMPITGSFTRTAINHSSGVKTPAGGASNVLIIMIALTALTSTFYYIPKTSLAGLIITALFPMIDLKIFSSLWNNSIKEFIVLIVTIFVCLLIGLEFGIVVGILVDLLILLFYVAKPRIDSELVTFEKGDVMIVSLTENMSYCAIEHACQSILSASSRLIPNTPIIIDGGNVKRMDCTSTRSLMTIVKDLEKARRVWFLNFDGNLKKLCLYIEPRFENNFYCSSSIAELTSILLKDV